jgi:filamentous hemagglutinin
MPKLTETDLGAGGSWKPIGEHPDPSVSKQISPYSCVAAVGEMLLRERGIIVSQRSIIDIIGEPSDLGILAKCLNDLDTENDGKQWVGLIISRKNIIELLISGSFGAVLRDGSPLGHLVLVKKCEDRQLIINDPWDGTSYRLSIYEFFRHWNGEVIFRWNL